MALIIEFAYILIWLDSEAPSSNIQIVICLPTLHAESPSIFLDKSGRGRTYLGRSKETLRAGYCLPRAGREDVLQSAMDSLAVNETATLHKVFLPSLNHEKTWLLNF